MGLKGKPVHLPAGMIRCLRNMCYRLLVNLSSLHKQAANDQYANGDYETHAQR
jgi:hypothetical protein